MIRIFSMTPARGSPLNWEHMAIPAKEPMGKMSGDAGIRIQIYPVSLSCINMVIFPAA
jgi:hypothetical protein